jgi:quercetin dioxygenase-like cupin family protein
MNTSRLACGLLAAGVVAAVAASGPAAGPAPGKGPPAVTVSKPPSETLTPLLAMALPNVKGKTFTAATVNFPPAARAVPHRHGKAFVYAYVLNGTIASKLDGEPVRTYHRGENWFERPGAHHVLTANTSRTKPAKLLVVFISNTGDKLKVDDPAK